ncbi:hypothetical protein HYPSUDRAFT_732792 [Hypholoma sublateritium FD-334 SS-4]|uniref:Uncharacterized protein n=1 Tax=Hypholoma sublateritium (strain FD-334 SS-4) TaxID=945553 RepID=A0A0D2L3Q7_HYPSF|nr:hypothetical protein HYPSUDRAFT_732792 [Hypholoma sublateritium FD-334 SS-4]
MEMVFPSIHEETGPRRPFRHLIRFASPPRLGSARSPPYSRSISSFPTCFQSPLPPPVHAAIASRRHLSTSPRRASPTGTWSKRVHSPAMCSCTMYLGFSIQLEQIECGGIA